MRWLLLTAFHSIRYEHPGYPVYKGFIVPYREGNQIVDAKRVTDVDVEKWRSVLENLRKFLQSALEWVRDVKLSQTEEIELICDLIALYFRLPLVREPIPSVAPSPLKAYLLLRLTAPKQLVAELRDPIRFVESAYSQEVIGRFLESNLAKMLGDRSLCEAIEHCWFAFPADTRPSLNTSGLIPHLLLTSALAWAIGVSRRIEREKLALIRLAAMLHDMGKPFRYANHVAASQEVARALLEGVLAPKKVYEVVEFVREHHSESATIFGTILQDADSFASALDRLRALSTQYVGERLEELAKSAGLDVRDAFERKTSWDFWRKFYEVYGEDKLRELTEKFVREIRKQTSWFIKPIPTGIDKKCVDNVDIMLIDVGGIQQFIRRGTKLRCVVAASLVIDCLVMAQLIIWLQHEAQRHAKAWLPYEAVLYGAGGVVELLIPESVEEELEQSLKKVKKITENIGIPIRWASTPLTTDYADTLRRLADAIHRKKYEIEYDVYPVKNSKARGVRNLCEICFQDYPTTTVSTPEGEKKACKTCESLYKIGGELHFARKYNAKLAIKGKEIVPRDVYGMNWEGKDLSASQYAIELVAGHDREELEQLREGKIELRNVSVIKTDGNLVGPFMATCVSPTDAYERSARIDLALKKAIERSVEALFDGVSKAFGENEAKKVVAATKLGLLYAGGDDAAMLAPSWAAPTIALVLGEQFELNLGGARGLSVGIAAASAKSSIWSLLDAAESLLYEAKKFGRKAEIKKSASQGSSPISSSAVCFDVIETGALSGTAVDARLSLLRAKMLTKQPLFVTSRPSFKQLLSSITGPFNSYEELAKESFLISRYSELAYTLKQQVESKQQRLKRIRDAIRSAIAASQAMISNYSFESPSFWEYIISISYLYGVRQAKRAYERGDVETRKAYETAASYAPTDPGSPASYADVDRLIKLLGGGVI